jgi:hypothetical protein
MAVLAEDFSLSGHPERPLYFVSCRSTGDRAKVGNGSDAIHLKTFKARASRLRSLLSFVIQSFISTSGTPAMLRR